MLSDVLPFTDALSVAENSMVLSDIMLIDDKFGRASKKVNIVHLK
jgi:hypothetical protein